MLHLRQDLQDQQDSFVLRITLEDRHPTCEVRSANAFQIVLGRYSGCLLGLVHTRQAKDVSYSPNDQTKLDDTKGIGVDKIHTLSH